MEGNQSEATQQMFDAKYTTSPIDDLSIPNELTLCTNKR
jgi:hypothetical protein